MFNTIKEKLVNTGKWIKRKIKEILIALGIITIAIAAPLLMEEPIPEHLKLKCPKERVLFSQQIKGKDTISYLYASETEVPLKKNEIKRTKNAQIFLKGVDKKGNKEYVGKFFAGEPFYQDLEDEKWYQTETATTTKKMFEKQMKVGWLEKLLFVYAVSTTTYSGAGDGYVKETDAGGDWDTAHDAVTGDEVGYANSWDYPTPTSKDSTTADGRILIGRGFIPFDTSALPDDATIVTSTLSLYVESGGYKVNEDDDGDDWVNVVQTTASSTVALFVEDYDQCGSVNNPGEGATRIDFTDIAEGDYTTWTLNATGTGWISLSGYTELGVREGHDAIDSPIAQDTQNTVYFFPSETAGTNKDPYLTITYTVPSPQEITTDAASGIDDTSAKLNATLDIKDSTSSNVYFEYGTSSSPLVTATYSASTTPENFTASSTASSTVTGIDTLEIWDYRGMATSALGNDTGDPEKFFTADASDMDYTLAHLSEGTFATSSTTTDPSITLEDLGGESEEDEESFEINDGDWVDQSCTNCSNECWVRGNSTPSGSTGPATNHGAEASNYFQFLESSSGYCYDSGDIDTIEYTFTGAPIYVDFYYHMYGAHIDILAIDSYYGAAWHEEWSIENQQHAAESTAWTRASTTIDSTATKIRFRGTRNTTGYWGDMAFDVVRIYVGGIDYATSGHHINPALDLGSITNYDDSIIVWSGTTTGTTTTLKVYTEANTSSSSPPSSGWNLATSSEEISDLSGDLSGKYLWVKQELTSSDNSLTPEFAWMVYGINTSAVAPTRRIIPVY